jgi:hypothetical protein
LIEKPEEKRSLGRPRNRLEDNTEMKEIRWENVDWIIRLGMNGMLSIVNVVKFHKFLECCQEDALS